MMGDGRCKNRRDIAGQKRIAGKRDPTIFRVRIFNIKLFPFLKPHLLFAGCYCSCRFILPCFFFLLCCNRYAIVTHFYNCHFSLIVLPVHHCRQFHLQLHAASLQGVILHDFRPATQYTHIHTHINIINRMKGTATVFYCII